jgi:LysM repeat protein
VDRLCPLLALATDGRTVVDGADAGHACHAADEALPLGRSEQAQLCLTAQHDRCERYRQHVARRAGSMPGRLAAGDGMVSTRLVVTPEPAWRGIAGRARRGRSSRAAVLGGTVLASIVAGAALARPALDGSLSVLDAAPPSTPAASPSASASATPMPASTPRLTPPATRSPAPRPTASPTPLPSPTAEPTPAPSPAPTPAPVRTYVVQQGDTLAEIAQQFGSTVAAIQAANGIEDPNEIVIGEVLVIP